MTTLGFGTASNFRSEAKKKSETKGEIEMNLGINTTKILGRNHAAKIIGGIVLGAVLAVVVSLQAGISHADSPSSPQSAGPSYVQQPLSESIQERLEVQRVMAAEYESAKPVSDSIQERLEVQRVMAAEYESAKPVSDSIQERLEMRRVMAAEYESAKPVSDSLQERLEVQRVQEDMLNR